MKSSKGRAIRAIQPAIARRWMRALMDERPGDVFDAMVRKFESGAFPALEKMVKSGNVRTVKVALELGVRLRELNCRREATLATAAVAHNHDNAMERIAKMQLEAAKMSDGNPKSLADMQPE